jgi:hypothetical protein
MRSGIVPKLRELRRSRCKPASPGGAGRHVMKVTSMDAGTEKTFYFNVDIPFAHGL